MGNPTLACCCPVLPTLHAHAGPTSAGTFALGSSSLWPDGPLVAPWLHDCQGLPLPAAKCTSLADRWPCPSWPHADRLPDA